MMLAHNNYSRQYIERQYNSLLKCIGVRYMVWFVKQTLIEHTAENLDKWIDTSSYYRPVNIIIILTT